MPERGQWPLMIYQILDANLNIKRIAVLSLVAHLQAHPVSPRPKSTLWITMMSRGHNIVFWSQCWVCIIAHVVCVTSAGNSSLLRNAYWNVFRSNTTDVHNTLSAFSRSLDSSPSLWRADDDAAIIQSGTANTKQTAKKFKQTLLFYTLFACRAGFDIYQFVCNCQWVPALILTKH